MPNRIKGFDPNLDLMFERSTSLSSEQIWKGWTDPATLKAWFCPRPWKVTECRIDLRLGGEFYTLMEGPGGEKMPNHGCYLEVVPQQKLVWTNALLAGFRPSRLGELGFPFVATILLSSVQGATYYQALVKHGTEEARIKHEQIGFQEGWGAAFSQLEEVMNS